MDSGIRVEEEKMNNHFLNLISLLLLIALFGCSTNRPLTSRGISSDERRHYIIQNGYGVTKEIKESFLAGFPMVDMHQDMIFELYGAPDRTLKLDTVWEYVDKSGNLITGFRFKDKKVVEITGDPRGGVPIEAE
jgi:hypothetical protein